MKKRARGKKYPIVHPAWHISVSADRATRDFFSRLLLKCLAFQE